MKNYRILILHDKDSWISGYVKVFAKWLFDRGYQVIVTDQYPETEKFEICFMLSYSKVVTKKYLLKSKHNIVVHSSALPQGKGWSPLTWQILEGKNIVPVTLFEAVESVDSGDIYIQRSMKFLGTELVEELRQIQGNVIMEMCKEFVVNYPEILHNAKPQQGKESFYPRRRPADSRLDVDKTLAEQFNLLRVVDNNKYPAYFEYKGKRYRIKIYLE